MKSDDGARGRFGSPRDDMKRKGRGCRNGDGPWARAAEKPLNCISSLKEKREGQRRWGAHQRERWLGRRRNGNN